MSLKKPVLAAALAAACAAPAFAQSSVTIYGRLYPYVLEERGSGATAPGTTLSTIASTATPTGVNAVGTTRGMEAGNSRLGFRGVEDLGGGLKATFQLEGVVDVDAGGTGGFQFDRDTFVGLSGGFGTVRLGNLDTIFKNYGDTIGILGLSSGTFMSSSNILRKPGFGTNNASRFHERRPNSFQYESPAFSNFQLGLQYATGEAASSDPIQPKTYSIGVKYDKGPFYVALAHEIHKDFFGGSRNVRTALRNPEATADSRDHATQLTVEWRINRQHKVGLDVIRKSYNESATAGRFQSYDNTAYQLAVENRWTSNFRTAASYVRSNRGSCTLGGGAVCNTEGLEGNKVVLGARYDLSRRTGLFAAYSQTRNGKSAQYGSREFGRNPVPGEDIRHVAVGVVHSF